MTKPFVRPDVQGVLGMLTAQEGPPMHETPPEVARQMLLAMTTLAEMPRGELARCEDFTISSGHGHDIPARIYQAKAGGEAGPVMTFYHGGGWVIGDLDTHDSFCAEVARLLDMTVVSVDYRLAPEHPFPAAGEDCIAATKWAASGPAEIGHPVTGIVPCGDSAGGNMAAVVCQELHGQLPVPIIAQWLIYPAVDMAAATGSMVDFAEGYLLTKDGVDYFMRHYLGGQDAAQAKASPLNADLTGQPPALVFTCGLDPLRDQGRAYAGKLIASGVRTIFREAEGQIHSCITLRMAIPSAQADIEACVRDLKFLLSEAQ
ncbi:alpha/beta hydrolase [Pacificimonas sp. WHA3]|uniref:Alpha/beta hydrolase n=1 Tax=Pacificimonas pallii TaxID=2827236 RepID=A0ABS6SGX1_9SPHN|nr:alpha/beta hydrolase [Pacificimonas pallii]MBV7257283.1 alpha/beta hydrolase [Pacificimonas pallii]